jgi:hypothetical protein
MVRRQGVGFNHDFEIMIVEVPEDLEIISVDFARLKKGWRQFNNYSYCQPIGDDWYNGGKPPLLKLLRSSTGVFELPTKRATCGLQQIKLVDVTELVPDERIEDILKKHKQKS